jgi:hypothetical protein
MNKKSSISRRQFITTGAVAAGMFATPSVVKCHTTPERPQAPLIFTSSRTRTRKVVGNDEFTFEIEHDWPKLPDKYTWQTTHNVALDKAGNLYVIHEGNAQWKEHPAIFVFDTTGQFIKAFGSQFQGGGHGIEIRQENGEEFIYVAAYQQVKAIAKLDLNGTLIWYRRAPMESGVYAVGEDKSTAAQWGRDRFLPTNFAFLPDGDFLLSDGYGSFFIHRYDQDGNWKSCFGGPGIGEGKFDTPHGIWLDSRDEENLKLMVTDRAHHTVQILTAEGHYLQTLTGFGLPANIDSHQNLLLIPELKARLSLLDKNNNVVARLGADVERLAAPGGDRIRNDRSQWHSDRFVHPHDACFDPQGNIFVAEWVSTGRISRLRRL